MFGLNPYLLGGTAAVFAALTLAVGVQTARLDHAKADLVKERAAAAQAKALAGASEEARGREAEGAKTAYAGLQASCDAGLKIALQRGKAIERILSAPAPASGGRGIVGADSLRDIVGQSPDPTP